MHKSHLFSIPEHLSHDMCKWVSHIVETYDIDTQAFLLLVKAGEAHDRGEEARKVLAKHGATYLDRWKCPHSRPEIAIERDCRLAFLRCLRDLGLETEAPVEAPPQRRPRIAPKTPKDR